MIAISALCHNKIKCRSSALHTQFWSGRAAGIQLQMLPRALHFIA